ncbi:DoxX family protein [Chitinophaga nivalis]|uniref:DoxX family protein n=1 Tax=Chitinophaga nivalis TaxID=2991709 RepID=A0ABT3IJF7_9BACT|nr:DoxX family protein [Chitinophaga nivalis]MCW3466230.1 DoxX family protein [Chitinophaga nivalis]MCW3484079.1 DoxX family protein [Chitinophaga nivalis]
MTTIKSTSIVMRRTGLILYILCILFLLPDAIMKIVKAGPSIKGSVELGWPEHLVPAIGIILLIATILYAIPRTAILGAILLTGYLGGAYAIMLRIGAPAYFPIIFGVLVWAALFLQDERLRALIPFSKKA